MVCRRGAVVVGIAVLLGGTALTGCGELIETKLCREAADKICTKWFSCFPVISATVWISKSNCDSYMSEWCDHSEYYSGCDIDNATLRNCRDGIDGSPCGSLPSSCYDLVDCYKANPYQP